MFHTNMIRLYDTMAVCNVHSSSLGGTSKVWRSSDSPTQCSQTSWNIWYITGHWSIRDHVSVVLLDFWMLCDLQRSGWLICMHSVGLYRLHLHVCLVTLGNDIVFTVPNIRMMKAGMRKTTTYLCEDAPSVNHDQNSGNYKKKKAYYVSVTYGFQRHVVS